MPTTAAYLIAYAAVSCCFLALDAAWLTLYAVSQFQSAIGTILRAQPDVLAAAAFYVLYPIGLVVLAIAPALAAGSMKTAALKGAMLGLTAYATFDLTNLAIIQGWTLGLALTDMAWGTMLSAVAAAAGYAAGSRVSAGRVENAQTARRT